MRRPLIAALLVLLAWLPACNGEGRKATRAQLPELDAEQLAAVPAPELIYRQAYELAQEEITAETAWERLREIERAVERASVAGR